MVEPKEGSEASSDMEMDSDVVGEGANEFVVAHRERSSSTSSVESVDSTLSHLIPACVWNVVSFDSLPCWLKDNEYLRHGYRPPMQSFSRCFGSMFPDAYRDLEHLDAFVWCGDVLCVSTLCLCVWNV